MIGHDWGAYTAGRFALWHPDRLHALVMMSVAYTPPSRQHVPIEEVVKRVPNLGYQVYLGHPKSSHEVLANLKKFLSVMYARPDSGNCITSLGNLEKILLKGPLPEFSCLLSDKELDYYYSQMSMGMFGPLNYYRTVKLRHEEELAAGLPARLPADLPFLFIWGTKDPTTTPASISNSRKFIERYQDVALEGRGHWLMIEAKDEVTKTISQWLDGLTCSKPPREFLGKL